MLSSMQNHICKNIDRIRMKRLLFVVLLGSGKPLVVVHHIRKQSEMRQVLHIYILTVFDLQSPDRGAAFAPCP